MLTCFCVRILGVVSRGHDWISGSELEVTVTPGDNITLYCDCKTSSGEYIVWFKNCSHEYQPSLVLRTRYVYRSLYLVDTSDILNPFPHLSLVKNQSSGSYDLRIVNITQSNEGHYYCGTEQTVNTVSKESVYRYGNITTRILLSKYSNLTPLSSYVVNLKGHYTNFKQVQFTHHKGCYLAYKSSQKMCSYIHDHLQYINHYYVL